MIPKSGHRFSEKRSCSDKKLERDDDSKKSHPAIGVFRLVLIELPTCITRGLDPRVDLACNGFVRRRWIVGSSSRCRRLGWRYRCLCSFAPTRCSNEQLSSCRKGIADRFGRVKAGASCAAHARRPSKAAAATCHAGEEPQAVRVFWCTRRLKPWRMFARGTTSRSPPVLSLIHI